MLNPFKSAGVDQLVILDSQCRLPLFRMGCAQRIAVSRWVTGVGYECVAGVDGSSVHSSVDFVIGSFDAKVDGGRAGARGWFTRR